MRILKKRTRSRRTIHKQGRKRTTRKHSNNRKLYKRMQPKPQTKLKRKPRFKKRKRYSLMPKKAHAATVQLRVIEQPAPTPTYQTIFAAEPSPVQNTVHLSQWDDIAKQLPPHYSIPDVQIVELIRQYHPK